MKVGSRVSHELFGIGEILAVRDGGSSFHVKFGSRPLAAWVPAKALQDLDALQESIPSTAAPRPESVTADSTPTRSAPPPRPGASDASRFSARRLIEALRLGIVPPDEVSRFTFGRDDEKEEMADWLRDPDCNFRLLVGEYGSGKSHFLECMRGMALEQGYAVSLISLEPNQSPLYRPKRVYQRLVRNLEYFDVSKQRRGFHEFLLDGAQREHDIWQDDFVLSPFHQELKSHRMEESRWDLVSGNEVMWMRPLYDDSTSANIYCHLLSAYSVIARDCLDLKGLLLLFDEAEMIEVTMTQFQVRRGYNFLHGLSLVAGNDGRLVKEEVQWYSHNEGRRFGSEDGAIGSQTKLRYSGRLQMPFSVKQPVALKAVFAFAPAVILEEPGFQGFDRVELEPLNSSALADALKATASEYAKAYRFRPNGAQHPAIARRLLEHHFASPRLFIKAGVEALDLLRLYPDEDPLDVLGDAS